MNNHEKILQYLLDNLVIWKPKVGNVNVTGAGFNEHNVVLLEPTSLPTVYEYDLVYINAPIINTSGVTTGSRGSQRATETYVVDLYTKRGGSGNIGRLATLKASNENSKVIVDLLASQGFIISMPQTDLNYANTSVARQIINITRLFIK